MTEHYTKEEAVELAREFDEDSFKWDGIGSDTLLSTVNTAVARKLAENELEVVRLREALEMVDKADACRDFLSLGEMEKIQEALSTPSSTKHLDEYVAGKVKEALKGRP